MSVSLEHLPALLRATYQVLATRVLLFVALLMTFGLFCWAMWMGTTLSLWVAIAFGALIFLPILVSSVKESRDGN